MIYLFLILTGVDAHHKILHRVVLSFAKHTASQLIPQNVNLFFMIKEYCGKTHLGNAALGKTKLFFLFLFFYSRIFHSV